MHRLLLVPAAGTLTDDDASDGQGRMLFMDTDDRREAERFIAEDPFTKAGLLWQVTVTCWRKASFNRERLV